MKITSGKFIGHLLATFTITIWGTTFIISKILLEEFSSLQVMIMRFIIAYITLFFLNHKVQKTSWKEELSFLSLAITGTTIYFLFENKALTLTFASNVSIILSVAPILTAILAHFYTKDEKLNEKILLGSIVAFAGVALVVFNGTVVLQLNPIGDLLSLGAAFSWAIYSVILKKHVNQYDSLYLTRKVVFYSIITTLPMLLFEGKPFPFNELKNPQFMMSLLFLGVLGSGICYVAWSVASRKLGIIATNNYIYLSPFVTMAAGSIFLDENINVMGFTGALLIISGVVVAGMKSNIRIKKIEGIELD